MKIRISICLKEKYVKVKINNFQLKNEFFDNQFKILNEIFFQMLISLFLAYCQCSQRKYYVTTYLPVIPLDSFGFEENGTFEINLLNSNRSTLIIFLATFDEMKSRIIHEISFLDICQNPKIHLSALNSSFYKNTKMVYWRGSIKRKDVYYPYILNCNRTKSKYTISTNFTNPASHLDLRDEFYPYFYTGLSYIYMAITVIYVINFLIFPSFGILIPPILAVINTTKSMITSKYAQIWLDRRIGLYSYDYFGTYFFNFIYILHYTAFLSFPTFIIAGWCIYRETIPFFESLIIVLSALIFVLGVWSFRFTLSLKDIFVSIGFVMIGFLSVVRNNVDYIMISSHLNDVTSRSLVQFRKKLSLVLRFDAAFLSILIALALLYSMALSFDFWSIVSDFIFEILMLSISVVELYLFIYRKEFEGDQNDFDENGVVRSSVTRSFPLANNDFNVNRMRFYDLNDPTSSCIALVVVEP